MGLWSFEQGFGMYLWVVDGGRIECGGKSFVDEIWFPVADSFVMSENQLIYSWRKQIKVHVGLKTKMAAQARAVLEVSREVSLHHPHIYLKL